MSKKPRNSSRGRATQTTFIASPLFVIIGIVVALFLIVRLGATGYERYLIKQEIASYEAQRTALERKKLESLDLLAYVSSDGFIEETARTELNMILPGERTAIIQTGDGNGGGRLDQTTEQTAWGNVVSWWTYFLQ
jgi:hypothetical protein